METYLYFWRMDIDVDLANIFQLYSPLVPFHDSSDYLLSFYKNLSSIFHAILVLSVYF